MRKQIFDLLREIVLEISENQKYRAHEAFSIFIENKLDNVINFEDFLTPFFILLDESGKELSEEERNEIVINSNAVFIRDYIEKKNKKINPYEVNKLFYTYFNAEPTISKIKVVRYNQTIRIDVLRKSPYSSYDFYTSFIYDTEKTEPDSPIVLDGITGISFSLNPKSTLHLNINCIISIPNSYLLSLIKEFYKRIDDKEDLMNKITKAIKDVVYKSGFELKKIILFGSRARSDFDKLSDWDIVVIIREELNRKQIDEISYKINSALSRISIPSDVIVISEKILEKKKDDISSVIYDVLREGIVIWEAK